MVGVRQVFLAVTMHIDRAVENIYYCYPVAWAATLLLVAIYFAVQEKRCCRLEKNAEKRREKRKEGPPQSTRLRGSPFAYIRKKRMPHF